MLARLRSFLERESSLTRSTGKVVMRWGRCLDLVFPNKRRLLRGLTPTRTSWRPIKKVQRHPASASACGQAKVFNRFNGLPPRENCETVALRRSPHTHPLKRGC